MDVPALRTIPFLRRNGLARTDSVLAYGHRGCRQAGVGTGQTPARTTGQRGIQGKNIVPGCTAGASRLPALVRCCASQASALSVRVRDRQTNRQTDIAIA